MTQETGLIILAVVVLAVLAWLWLTRSQGPKPKTQRLAMTVWAAFGPYETAEEAEKYLRRASRVVFGAEGVTEHEAWIAGHVNNFRDWEAEGRFAEAHKMMCASHVRTQILILRMIIAQEDQYRWDHTANGNL